MREHAAFERENEARQRERQQRLLIKFLRSKTIKKSKVQKSAKGMQRVKMNLTAKKMSEDIEVQAIVTVAPKNSEGEQAKDAVLSQ